MGRLGELGGYGVGYHPENGFRVADMARRPANITQADLARAIRAAKQTGAAEVEVRIGDKSRIIIRINQSTNEKITLEEPGEVVL
jgi:DNA-binding XRE family transcriptional regulator